MPQGKSLRFIGKTLSRNVSTINREVGYLTLRGSSYKSYLNHYYVDRLFAGHNTEKDYP
jgi:hypothetical protein